MAKWLGHRDLCPTQWGAPCSCPCADVACPGVDRCGDPDCLPAKLDLAGTEVGETTEQEEVPDGA